jgi:hypothetical protein
MEGYTYSTAGLVEWLATLSVKLRWNPFIRHLQPLIQVLLVILSIVIIAESYHEVIENLLYQQPHLVA